MNEAIHSQWECQKWGHLKTLHIPSDRLFILCLFCEKLWLISDITTWAKMLQFLKGSPKRILSEHFSDVKKHLQRRSAEIGHWFVVLSYAIQWPSKSLLTLFWRLLTEAAFGNQMCTDGALHVCWPVSFMGIMCASAFAVIFTTWLVGRKSPVFNP